MRRSPRSLLLRAAALLVAVGTGALVARDLATLHERARGLGPIRDVVVAAHDLPLGAVVTVDDLDVVRRHDSQVAPGALDARRAAVGRVVAVPVLRGAPVFARHLTDADRTGIDGLVAPGQRAVHVRPADGLRPPPGSLVDVLATLDPGLVFAQGNGEPTTTIVSAATVVALDDSEGDAGVVLLVSEAEAQRLAFSSANGVITLALAPPEDACCTTSSSASSRD